MRIKTKTTLVIILCLAIIVVLGVIGWKHFHNTDTANTTQPTQSGKINNINYRPPTDADKKAGEQTKQQNQQAPSTTPSSPTTTTDIVISRLAQVSAGQNVNLRATLSSNVLNAECVAVFTKAGQSSVTQTAGIATNPTYYSCEPIDVSPDQLGIGSTWQVSVYVQQNGNIVSNKATGSITVK